MHLTLQRLPAPFTIHRLAPDAPLPAAARDAGFVFTARTDEELSIVCPSSLSVAAPRSEAGWCCLKVQGPLDFELKGVLAELSTRLAGAGLSLFALSTFDTDYLLVRRHQQQEAMAALRQAGHTVLE